LILSGPPKTLADRGIAVAHIEKGQPQQNRYWARSRVHQPHYSVFNDSQKTAKRWEVSGRRDAIGRVSW